MELCVVGIISIEKRIGLIYIMIKILISGLTGSIILYIKNTNYNSFYIQTTNKDYLHQKCNNHLNGDYWINLND